jgi:hypothetical protein
MPKYPTSNAAAAFSTHRPHTLTAPSAAVAVAAVAARSAKEFAGEADGDDVTEPLTGKRTPLATGTRPYYAAAVAVMQLLAGDIWMEALKPFGGLRSRCPDLETLGIHSDEALLAALNDRMRADFVEASGEKSAWSAALRQCARVAFEKLMAAVSEGWLSPLMFDRDGNTVMHIALRCWDARALAFLDGQVRGGVVQLYRFGGWWLTLTREQPYNTTTPVTFSAVKRGPQLRDDGGKLQRLHASPLRLGQSFSPGGRGVS